MIVASKMWDTKQTPLLPAVNSFSEKEMLKIKLKKQVRALMEESKNLPVLLKMKRSLAEHVCQLEQCIMYKFRNNMVLERKIQFYTQCQGADTKDISLSCMQRKLSEKVEGAELVDAEIAELRRSQVETLNRAKALAQLVADRDKHMGRMGEEIQELIRIANVQRTLCKEKERDFQTRRNELIVDIENGNFRVKENGKLRQRDLLYHQRNKEELEKKHEQLTQEYTELRKNLESVISHKGTILDRNRITEEEIEERRRKLEENDARLEELHKQITTLDEENKRLDITITNVTNEIDNAKEEIEHRGQDEVFRQKVRESEQALDGINEIKNRVLEENAALMKSINSMKDTRSGEYRVEHLKKSIDTLYGKINRQIENLNVLDGERESSKREIETLERKYSEINMYLKGICKIKQSKYERDCSTEVRAANNLLLERITHLENTLKDDHLEQLKLMKRNLCSNYENLWRQVEHYERVIDENINKMYSIKGKIVLLTNENEALELKVKQLEIMLEKLRFEAQSQREEQDRNLNCNKRLGEKLRRLNNLYSLEQENTETLRSQVRSACSDNSANLEQIELRLKTVKDTKANLDLRSEELTNEYNELIDKYNIVMKANGALAQIIKKIQNKFDDENKLVCSETLSGSFEQCSADTGENESCSENQNSAEENHQRFRFSCDSQDYTSNAASDDNYMCLANNYICADSDGSDLRLCPCKDSNHGRKPIGSCHLDCYVRDCTYGVEDNAYDSTCSQYLNDDSQSIGAVDMSGRNGEVSDMVCLRNGKDGVRYTSRMRNEGTIDHMSGRNDEDIECVRNGTDGVRYTSRIRNDEAGNMECLQNRIDGVRYTSCIRNDEESEIECVRNRIGGVRYTSCIRNDEGAIDQMTSRNEASEMECVQNRTDGVRDHPPMRNDESDQDSVQERNIHYRVYHNSSPCNGYFPASPPYNARRNDNDNTQNHDTETNNLANDEDLHRARGGYNLRRKQDKSHQGIRTFFNILDFC